MSSIAKSNISLSKKDLSKSRIPPVASRNVVFYHKATSGQLTINLLALTLPSAEMPTVSQATVSEISGANLTVNKKNLDLTSSSKGKLIQGLDYIVIDAYNISLTGPYESIGAEVDEIFVGTINSAPISDIVVASAKSVTKTYTLAVGSTTLNLGQEYQVGVNPNEDVGIIKVYVNGILAIRDSDYQEVDTGSGYGTTIQFLSSPATIPWQVVVDFGVMAITDNDAIGSIQNLAGSIKKIADDLSVVAGTSASDYYSASPSDIERRAFGDTILSLDSKYDTTQNLSAYTKTMWQEKTLPSNITTAGDISALQFNNLTIGKTYRVFAQMYVAEGTGSARAVQIRIKNNSVILATTRIDNPISTNGLQGCATAIAQFVATATTVAFEAVFTAPGAIVGDGTRDTTFVRLEQLPNHEVTTAWT